MSRRRAPTTRRNFCKSSIRSTSTVPPTTAQGRRLPAARRNPALENSGITSTRRALRRAVLSTEKTATAVLTRSKTLDWGLTTGTTSSDFNIQLLGAVSLGSDTALVFCSGCDKKYPLRVFFSEYTYIRHNIGRKVVFSNFFRFNSWPPRRNAEAEIGIYSTYSCIM